MPVVRAATDPSSPPEASFDHLVVSLLQTSAMPTTKVEVKWGKEVFKDVEIDMEQPPSVFKTQLFSLTGVPPERQKIMGVKGGLLKDDADWAKLGLKPGQKLTMMGTAETLPEAPKQQQTFMEDLPEDEQDATGAAAGSKLQHHGSGRRCPRWPPAVARL